MSGVVFPPCISLLLLSLCRATGDGKRRGSWAEWCGCFAEVTGGLETSLLEHPLQNADSVCAL